MKNRQTNKDKQDIILDAIELINRQLMKAQKEGRHDVVNSHKAAIQEFIKEWQGLRGV